MPSPVLVELKQQLLAATHASSAQGPSGGGLNRGASGNLSFRQPDADSFWITPSGVENSDVQLEDLVHVDFEGKRLEGDRRASSEWPLHAEIYRNRKEFSAVIHTHSTYASALSCTRRSIPAFHYMVLMSGCSEIRCAEYALFGSHELAENAVKAMHGGKACLLANHGVLVAEKSMHKALNLAQEVESLAQQYLLAEATGELVLLTEEEMNAASMAFKGYGQTSKGGDS